MDIRKIGISTSAFGYIMGSVGRNTDRKNSKPWTLEQFIDFASRQGFGGVEAPLSRFIPGLDNNRLEHLQTQLSKQGLFFVMDSEVALDVSQIRSLIPSALRLGSPIIRIKSSDILGCARKELGRPWSLHVENCIAALKSVAPELRRYGLKIAVENHQDLDSNDLIKIVESVGRDVVGVNFDIGNAFSVCEEPMIFARKLGSAILNIHLKDYKIFQSKEGFRLVRCPLGSGSVDFRKILPFLAETVPDARMVIELGALEARNIAWLSQDFWQEIQARDQTELDAFSELLKKQYISGSKNNWRTPWELGSSADKVVNYELEEFEISKKYLTTL